jgi:hypothetical protein
MAGFQISEGVVFRELEGEAVLLHLDSGLYFGLDRIGTRVWQLVAEHGRMEPVIDTLLEEYEVAPDVLRADVSALLDALLDKGLVLRSSDASAGA